MRRARSWQVEEGFRYFHCVSRVVNRDHVFGEEERETFRRILHKVAAFSGVEVLTWTILSNHFHVLLYVPEMKAVTEDEVLGRIGKLYSKQHLREVEWQLEQWDDPLFAEPRRALLESYTRRMFDLSEFMKMLKQRFSIWFNRKHGRKGTLWEERFRSVAVGGNCEAILTVAGYIDLNCVRAGLADDPKDYRWCGYAEAVAGKAEARRGLTLVLQQEGRSEDWRHTGAIYRTLLFGTGEERGALKRGIDRKKVARVLEQGGQLSRAELLRCRVRYFSDGTVIGTKEFVDTFFEAKRESLPKRKSGARRMRGGDWGDLTSFRDLQLAPIQLE